MSTSNLAKAIGQYLFLWRSSQILLTRALADCAFVDRADIVQYVDLPPREAIYEILRTCLCEIVAKGIIATVVRPLIW